VPRKRHTPEEIVAKLRQLDVLVSQGRTVTDAVRRAIGTTEVAYRHREALASGRQCRSNAC
jgi:putative transposase